MRRVVIESPYGKTVEGKTASAEEIARNVEYARRAMRDSLDRGEAPFASHLLYTQVYDDADADERRAGIEAGLEWGAVANRVVAYTDYGITPGMKQGIARHSERGFYVEQRTIGKNP